MAALGELVVFLIELLLGLSAIVFFILTFTQKRARKLWTLFGSIFFCFLFFSYRYCLNMAYEQEQLDQVGIYYLTSYPNCDDCILELKKDMTYEIRSKDKIIEKSNWHYESGGDYWITYLDNDRHQLGSGDYAYGRYKLKSGQAN